MAEMISCTHCGAPLRLPDSFVGQEVRCPACQQTFTAHPPAEPPQVEGSSGIRRQAPPRYPDTRDEDDDEAARRARRRRAFEEVRHARMRALPHRGGTVLTLGIVSLCLFFIPAIALALGIGAVVMGNADLAKMRRGEMDAGGRGLTRAGVVCGVLGPLLTVLCVVAFCLLMQLTDTG